MSALPPLTVYSARICPWAQRTTLALREVGAYKNNQVEHVEIDLQNKPSWYAEKVNPASKVPVLRVGAESDPSSVAIPESAVLLELVAELFPASKLSPENPVERAQARYFYERFSQVVNAPFGQLLYQNDLSGSASLLAGVEEIQKLLARTEGDFLLGSQITIGDLAVAPFVGRIFAAGKAGLIPGDSFTALSSDAKYAPFRAYHQALTSRPSWAETFDEEYVVEFTKKRIEKMRAEKAQK
ncbi:hypothetical protein JCM6882_000909 [Rhodosporidiobolus microsporus]